MWLCPWYRRSPWGSGERNGGLRRAILWPAPPDRELILPWYLSLVNNLLFLLLLLLLDANPRLAQPAPTVKLVLALKQLAALCRG
jgi:hypothetical protein